ncbi:MAG: 4Fe-4S binding protein [Promethearchaeota archaeon]
MPEFLTINPTVIILMLILYAVIFTITTILMFKDKLTKKVSITLLFLSIFVSGFILGGIPNVVFPIQQFFLELSNLLNNRVNPFYNPTNLIPMAVILFAFLSTTIIFGRIFCSHVCPMGAAQELISKINYTDNPSENNYKIIISGGKANVIRIIFLIGIIISTIFFSFPLYQLIDPFRTFSVFSNISIVATAFMLIPIFVFTAIMITSLFIYRPWCRSLCPFGAIAWLTSRFSKYVLNRSDKCTNCQICEKICPTGEAFSTSIKAECYVCTRCFDKCKVKTIKFKKREKNA